jgi:Type III restriction enzyme, res subunit
MGGIVDDSVADALLLLSTAPCATPTAGSRSLATTSAPLFDRSVEAILQGDKRLLLTLATGTGKTFVSMQNLERIKAGRLQEAIDVILPLFEKACRYIPVHFQPTETLGEFGPRSSS